MNSGGARARGSSESRSIAVLLTVHDRKAHTLECLARIGGQQLPAGVSTKVYLVDDGCADGTPDAVRREFTEVRIIAGTGELYWNGGMRLAFEAAEREVPDFFLLLNDDTALDTDAISKLVKVSDELREAGHVRAIVVGSTRDPATGAATYGGLMRASRWAPRFALEPPGDTAKRCDTMNGNCVLVPHSVARKVGNLSAEFTHGYGDIDYGLRATDAGCSCWVAPGFVATCELNRNRGSFIDETLPVMTRWRKMLGPKGASFREWRAFTMRHCGPLWFAFWAGTYAKFWLRAPVWLFLRHLKRKRVSDVG
jgi:GT2 family glycosyltransferase